MSSELNRDIPLPENVELLSSQEVFELVTQHKRQLESYVAAFNPQEELKADVLNLKVQLQELEGKFKGLEEERAKVQEQLEECRILESQYVKRWQDKKYNEDLLKAVLEIQMTEVEDDSFKLEKKLNEDDDLDVFLDQYIEMRTNYHIKREKLATWNAQGTLRIR